MVVSTDAKNGWPSQDGRYVAYVSQGMLLVRELAKVPREEYEAALQEAEQQFIMGQAKQAALGLIMYASDNNDILPPSGDVSSLVRPYMKQDFPFTYTYTGGSMSNNENPATTVLGYVDGSNGRAIIHADGHVTWKK